MHPIVRLAALLPLAAALPASAQMPGQAPAQIPAQAPGFARTLSADALTRLSPHVWMIQGFPNIGIVVGDKATLVIDTGMGNRNAQTVVQVARKLSTKGQKLYLTTTHFHPEHAGGAGGFPPETVVIRPRIQQTEMDSDGQATMDGFSARSQEDRELLQGARLGTAGILFDKEYRLDLGGVTAHLSWFGPAHTRGDEVIFVEEDRLMFTGDVVQNRVVPGFNCAECSPQKWLRALDGVASLKPQIIAPDHSAVGDGALVAQEQAFLSDIVARTGALKAQGKTAEETARIVSEEFQVKYAGWTALARAGAAAQRAYGDGSAP